jgi:hypothetical protein
MRFLECVGRPIGGASGARMGFVCVAGAIAIGVPLTLYQFRPAAQAAVVAAPLGITVAGVTFSVPPEAIRDAAQRVAGAQDRLDLWFGWPDLGVPTAGTNRLFITIASENQTLPAAARLKSIYPHFAEAPSPSGFEGLLSRRFRDGTPYQHEEALYDAAHPDDFIARCNQTSNGTTATCLYERKVDDATLTFRFSREWLADWRSVRAATDRLLQQWHPVRG